LPVDHAAQITPLPAPRAGSHALARAQDDDIPCKCLIARSNRAGMKLIMAKVEAAVGAELLESALEAIEKAANTGETDAAAI